MTFAVLGRDARTGQIGGALATASIDSGRVSPWARGVVPRYTETGAIAMAHAAAAPILAHRALDVLEQGQPLADIEGELRAIDPNFEWRQMSVLTAKGELWVRTGETCYPYAGHASGADWIASGNALSGPRVVEAMADAMEAGRGLELADRLLTALEAGRDAGGQGNVETGESLPELSAVLYVVDGVSPMAVVDLRVDYDPSALEQLRKLYKHVKPLDWYFPVMWDRPWDLLEEAAARGAFDASPLE
jgi:uncharacterized Ntn-hydrolase superfamily protein